jgi:peptidoglycan/LPS O-acetylase OafA/YrhL
MRAKLDSLQVLRAMAAISVVAVHAFRAVTIFRPLPPDALLIPPKVVVGFFGMGVDVFFVLSGFLMAYISAPFFSRQKTVGQFVAQRIIRIWPPYVAATLIACALLFRSYLKQDFLPYDLQPFRFVGFFFIPTANEAGDVQPIIGPGWTLSYEMMFYALFAVVLWTGRKWAVAKLATLLGAVYVLGLALGGTVAGAFFATFMPAEFLAGAIVGFAVTGGAFKPKVAWLWILAAIAACCAGVALGLGPDQRVIALGVPAVLLFIGFLAFGDIAWPRWAILLGDASYSIYLIHILVVYRAVDFALRHMNSEALHRVSNGAAALFAVVVAVAVGLIFHFVIEKPLLRSGQWLYNRLSVRKVEAPLVAQ